MSDPVPDEDQTRDALGLATGDALSTVLLSPPILGTIRTWNGAPALWALPSGREHDWHVIGRGVLARTEVGPHRYREVALLSTTGMLVLLDRHGSHVPMGYSSHDAQTLSLRGTTHLPGDPQTAWQAFASWLGSVAVDAARRGEILLVELGGWPHHPHPYALFRIRRSATGDATSHIEASPAPTGQATPWGAASRDGSTAVLGASANLETVSVAGHLIAAAVAGWAPTPWDVCLTFTHNPDGPHAL